MHAIIYDQLMKAVIQIVQRLDLGLNGSSGVGNVPAGVSAFADAVRSSEPSASLASDPLQAAAPKKPKDFEIFLNLVEFLKLMLPKIHPHLFPRWACI